MRPRPSSSGGRWSAGGYNTPSPERSECKEASRGRGEVKSAALVPTWSSRAAHTEHDAKERMKELAPVTRAWFMGPWSPHIGLLVQRSTSRSTRVTVRKDTQWAGGEADEFNHEASVRPLVMALWSWLTPQPNRTHSDTQTQAGEDSFLFPLRPVRVQREFQNACAERLPQEAKRLHLLGLLCPSPRSSVRDTECQISRGKTPRRTLTLAYNRSPR
ncbi:hypothetical protein EYF80_027019 [Liparis tanakae]|uniref:Uncharacterized protein n=1 Tax=Liparis tanakae TaxID=230148 RepID=A0A4Z2HCP9_9TELE|nr:hypothetical protein EYF80_027019 [Liparis tanakae]